MADLNPAPYRGAPSTPHTSEDTFKVFMGGCWGFIGMNALQDFFEPRPAWTPDYVLALTEENKRKRMRAKGKQWEPPKVTDADPARRRIAELRANWRIERLLS